ncbi:MAG: nucleotidyltransferase family protein [Firmicutes bacterium]|nr:nucleotidyltransferase family protein [Bacillota bacterium]
MAILGIVAEYNPFHFGHLYQLVRSRALAEADGVVCVMSGDFVQRGDCALFSKHIRAEAAARSGADLVLELPLPWSLSSAEGFARGAVGLLGALGAVTHLGFGSECGELEPLQNVAEALLSPEADAAIKSELEEGVSYAEARQSAMEKLIGEPAKLLETPNNILAVEYLKAIVTQNLPIQPLTVKRMGAWHDSMGTPEFDGQLSIESIAPNEDVPLKSASELRKILGSGGDVVPYVPEYSSWVMKDAAERGLGPVTMAQLESALLSRLRLLDEDAYSRIPGAAEGLHNRLCRAAWTEPTLAAVLETAKTKRYALSRLRRMLLCAALGVPAELSEGIPPYARVLACTERGREILRDMYGRALLPILVKPAAVRELGPACEHVFTLGALAHDFYALGYPAPERRRGGEDWRASPALV